MEPLRIEATDKSPFVSFDPGSGVLELSGRSIHENASRFYEELYHWVDRMAARPPGKIDVRIALDYFNSSSAKYLLDILKRLDDLHATGGSKVMVEWTYEIGDLDMQEAGNDYKELLDMPVRVRPR
jgi:hypothetical protein